MRTIIARLRAAWRALMGATERMTYAHDAGDIIMFTDKIVAELKRRSLASGGQLAMRKWDP